MNLTTHEILNEVCDYFNVPESQIFKKTRERKTCTPRQFFFKLTYKYTRLSYEKIGRISEKYGHDPYDHATIIHAKKNIGNLIDVDFEIRKHWEYLDSILSEMSDFKNRRPMEPKEMNLVMLCETNQYLKTG